VAILLHKHGAFFDEVFALPDFFAEPVLCFGFQDMKLKRKKDKLRKPRKPRSGPERIWRGALRRLRGLVGLPPDRVVVVEKAPPLPHFSPALDVENLDVYLRNRGLTDVTHLDYFDARAQLRYDMNQPVPEVEHERYGTLIDIGCLEHVFDTRQCLENCLRMVRTGGTYFLHTPVNGFLGHGLHTFNPEGLVGALRINGFEILYHRYCAKDGSPLKSPGEAPDALIWLVGRKTKPLGEFEIPQQGKWYGRYDVGEEIREPDA
jgi:hypothetical protein